MAEQTILVVEDDPKIRNLLRNVLEGEGFRVLLSDDGAEVLELIARQPVSLVTLDIRLGSLNGLELAREIGRVSSVPIIMVTGRGDVIDRVAGLEVGADDYISKPFHVREVVARVRSVLRRAGAGATGNPRPAQPEAAGGLRALGRHAGQLLRIPGMSVNTPQNWRYERGFTGGAIVGRPAGFVEIAAAAEPGWDVERSLGDRITLPLRRP